MRVLVLLVLTGSVRSDTVGWRCLCRLQHLHHITPRVSQRYNVFTIMLGLLSFATVVCIVLVRLEESFHLSLYWRMACSELSCVVQAWPGPAWHIDSEI